MKRQNINALLPLHCVNTNDGRLARELDCRNNRVQLGYIEISLELFSRLPIFDEQ